MKFHIASVTWGGCELPVVRKRKMYLRAPRPKPGCIPDHQWAEFGFRGQDWVDTCGIVALSDNICLAMVIVEEQAVEIDFGDCSGDPRPGTPAGS